MIEFKLKVNMSEEEVRRGPSSRGSISDNGSVIDSSNVSSKMVYCITQQTLLTVLIFAGSKSICWILQNHSLSCRCNFTEFVVLNSQVIKWFIYFYLDVICWGNIVFCNVVFCRYYSQLRYYSHLICLNEMKS